MPNSDTLLPTLCPHRHALLSVCWMLLLGLSSSSVLAAEAITQSHDCSEIEVQADIDPELSRDENLQRLSEMFYESLNTVTHCQNASDSATSASTAASDISGTEAEESTFESDENTSEMNDSEAGYSEMNDSEAGYSEMDGSEVENSESDSGMDNTSGTKLPDDIPAADNDSVFEKQIREAAENESDPEIRERLWNEYRKYKGLPVKPVKEKL